ncbi:MAG: hypothetical protein OHK0029_16920 [Armatimonadaceae bacterium]
MKKTRRKQQTRRDAVPLPAPVRWMGTALVGIFGAWVLFEIVVKAVYPYQLGSEQAKKVAALEARLAEQNQRNAALEQEVKYLKSDEGKEVLARRAGYQRPNETVYFLTRPE